LQVKSIKDSHYSDLQALQEEDSAIEKEIDEFTSEISQLENDVSLTEQRLKLLAQEKAALSGSLKETNRVVGNIQSYIKQLTWKGGEENKDMEHLQVKNYEQTIMQANLDDELESLLAFLCEFIRRQKGDKEAEDREAFENMSEYDQQRIREALQTHNVYNYN